MPSPRRCLRLAGVPLLASLAGCAAARPPAPAAHGVISDLSRVDEEQPDLCAHKVPRRVCATCHPELQARFRSVGDWCPEHAIPESQCLICHPDLTFTPLPKLPPDADVAWLSRAGEDVPALFAQAAPGKLTIFDFYADWCSPCRRVDEHVHRLLQRRSDVAVRKINVVSWESPVARAQLRDVPTLPYLVLVGRDGQRLGVVAGLDLDALDRLLARGSTP